MALNYVTVTWNETDIANFAQGGYVSFAPSQNLTAPADSQSFSTAPRAYLFNAGTGASDPLVATDNTDILQFGWTYVVTIAIRNQPPQIFNCFINFANGASQKLSSLTPVVPAPAVLTPAVPGIRVSPSGDPSGITDQAAITAAEAAGSTVWFSPGLFWVTGLTKQSLTLWQGSGRNNTTVKLANGANVPVIQSANFSSLTLSGSANGANGFGIRDMTIDGNKANQTGTPNGVQIFGYDFDLSDISIRNAAGWGLYTEWGGAYVGPGPDITNEARYRSMKIYSNALGGWHDRGPHDSRSFDCTVSGNGSGFPNYWSEDNTGLTTAVAVGSNGVNVSTFTGSGVLNVNTTLNYPTASISATQGSITVATSGGTAVITYTGTTATSFTGCTTVSGSGTLSTGGAVTEGACGYGSNGTLHHAMHNYGGSASYQYTLDAQNHLLDCIAEVATTGSVLVRAPNTVIVGGEVFVLPGAPQTGCGIQLGDANNGTFASYIRTFIYNYACTSAATSCLNVVNDGGQCDVDVACYAPAGTVVMGGAVGASTSYKVRAMGQAVGNNDANSIWHERGQVLFNIPNPVGTAFTITSAGTDILNVNTSAGTKAVQVPNGYSIAWFSDNYVTKTASVNGSTGVMAPTVLAPIGLTGATTATRYVGGTAGGPPTSGTFAVGDFVIDQTANIFICTAAGTPGTWASPEGTQPWVPQDNGLAAATASMDAITNQITPVTAGTLYLVKVMARGGYVANKISYMVQAAGSGASTGSFVGLYSSAGTLLSGSADIGANLITGNDYQTPLTTPQTLAPGSFAWVAFLCNLATTQPGLAIFGEHSFVMPNLGLTPATYRVTTNGTGLTSLPASITPGSNAAGTSFCFWFGIS